MKKNFIRLILTLASCSHVFAQNAATSIAVDANVNRHTISPNIYGVAYAEALDMKNLNTPLNRWGGNSTSRYNWQIDAHSTGSDYYFETYPDGSGTPGASADTFVATTRSSTGAQPAFTIPMIDYLANLGPNRSTLEGFSVNKYGPQQAVDYWNNDAGNGVSSTTGKNITGNNPSDTGVPNTAAIEQAWVQHFVSQYGSAANGGIPFYLLDNEPSLWSLTHRDVHPSPATYQELYDKTVAYASAIRAADPTAKIAGFEEWSWWAMYNSGFDQVNGISASNSDYNAHNQTYYYPWLLQNLYASQQKTGTKMLDILTVHCYNQTPGNGDDSLAAQQTRNRETRILWDPTFQDPSWYGQVGINNGIVSWIPTLKSMVNQYYPGLQLGCTEYNWGDEPNLNGATTQADVLGIYGREGLDLATRWTVAKNTNTNPATYFVTYLASEIYRNYDGQKSGFGDTSVSTTVANPDDLSAFAAVRSSDGALTVMVINKQQGSTPVNLSLANFGTSGTAQVWQINSASQTSIAPQPSVTIANNSLSTTVPSQSITLFVIPAGVIETPPTAPTGLTATVASGTVNLAWNAAGGATSYVVKTATVSGGPYLTMATVPGATPAYTATGLTNGKTYYFVVSGANQGGSSPNSAQLTATPIIPPTFSAKTTASVNPVAQGSPTVVTFVLTDTSSLLSKGSISLGVYDSSGKLAGSLLTANQSFSTNQTRNYKLTFNPASVGTFQVQTRVFNSVSGQTWYVNSAALTITATPSLTFSSSATATPSSISVGSSVLLALRVTESGTSALSNGNVELQLFNSAGSALVTQVWSAQTFAAHQTQSYSYTWAVPAGLRQGLTPR